MLSFPPAVRIWVALAPADLRKGFDLFLQLWRLTRGSQPSSHFAWVGGIDPGLAESLSAEIAEARASGTFHLFDYRDDVDLFFSAADASQVFAASVWHFFMKLVMAAPASFLSVAWLLQVSAAKPMFGST